MKIIRNAQAIANFQKGCVATIGNFDGVHTGHRALLSQLKDKSEELNCPLVIIVFEPQPEEYFLEQPPARLSSLREKLLQLAPLQVDYVLCLKFDEKMAKMPPESFAEYYLFKQLKCQYLLVGEDFRFGHQRQGHFFLLKEIGEKYLCKVESFADFKLADLRISSSTIRQMLASNQLNQAKRLLGRTYSMCARVVKGNARGREWGVPTANLKLHRKAMPLNGVFCVQVKVKNEWFHGVANVGSRPTVDGRKNILEVHLLDFSGELYGQWLEVFFLHKLRNEVKFQSVDQLIQQIYQDINAAKQYFEQKELIE